MNPPVREEELLKQLLQVIDKIDLDEAGIREKIQGEIIRYRKFMGLVLGQQSEIEQRTIQSDVRNYAKYLLNEGSKEEKRMLLSCLRSNLELRNKTIYLKFHAKVT